MRLFTRVLLAATVAASVVASGVSTGANAAASGCVQRTLVVSAMPLELAPLLAEVSGARVVTDGARDYYLGTLRGHAVALTLTGIGPVNARTHVAAALADLRCGSRSAIDSVVFSGVAGGDSIGNVLVPTRWTADDGKHFLGVDPKMLAAARQVAKSHPALESKTPAGDPACACVLDPDTVDTVAVTTSPVMEVGGAGQTTDPFVGRALACVPGGGDVLGCQPCPAAKQPAPDATQFVPSVLPFVDPAFFTGYESSSAEDSSRFVVEDEETAAVDAVATAHHLPFIGFRGVSDGGGDPLHLPGFPVEFFYYRQLAGDNAAIATLKFLSAWRARR